MTDDDRDDERAIAEIMAEYGVKRDVAIDMLAVRRYGGDLQAVEPRIDPAREEVGLGRESSRCAPAPTRPRVDRPR